MKTLRMRLSALLVGLALGGWIVPSYAPSYAAIRSSKIASVTDSADTSKIQPSEMNPLTLPSVPVDGDIWFDRTGTSPTRTLAVKIYDTGAWRTISSISY